MGEPIIFEQPQVFPGGEQKEQNVDSRGGAAKGQEEEQQASNNNNNNNNESLGDEELKIALEHMTLNSLTAQVERDAAVREVELLRKDVAFAEEAAKHWRSVVGRQEIELAAAKKEALEFQSWLLQEKQKSLRPAEVEEEIAALKAEIQRERSSKDVEVQKADKMWKERMQAAEAELRDARKTLEEWKVERAVLDRAASLWRKREEHVKAKEAEAREQLAKECAELEEMAEREGIKVFLKHIYSRYPPKQKGKSLGALNQLDRTLKQALMHYHVDKQDVDVWGLSWVVLCKTICQIINNARE